MHKRIIAFCLLALGLGSLALYFISKDDGQKLDTAASVEAHPGFYEQWLTMKADENGEIPTGLYAEWKAQDGANASFKKRNATGIRTVKFIGPSNVGGRTRNMIIDAKDNKRFIAAGVSGGIWESKDKGFTWTPHDDLSANLNVSDIEQNPLDPDVIYYGTGEATGNSAGVPGEGIFKSDDGGKTYEQLPQSLELNFTYIWDIEHSTIDTNTFYVSVKGKGMYRSTNAGDSFELVYKSGANLYDIEIFPDGSIMLAVQSSGILYSESGDFGSWTRLGNGLPKSGFHRLEITYATKYPDVVFAQFTNGVNSSNGFSYGVWKSSNKGKSWKEVGNPRDYGANFAQPWFALGFQVDPNDTNFLATGGTNFYYSSNGGNSWGRAREGHADHHSFVFAPDEPGVFYDCNDGGIYRHSTSTISARASDRNSGYNVTQFYAGSYTPDTLGVLGGTQDNGSYLAANGNPNFNYVLGGDGAYCHIHQQNPDIAYASTQNGAIRKTENRSSSRLFFRSILNDLDSDFNGSVDDIAWFINPFEMNYLDGDELYFVTRRRLWMSVDAGSNWRPITGFKSNFYAVGIPDEKDPDKIYVGGQGLLLYRVDDPENAEPGDETNIRTNAPSGLSQAFIGSIEVDPTDDGIIYIGLTDYTNQPRAWRIVDADTDEPQWENISGDLPTRLPVNWIEVDPYRPDSFFMAGTDFGLYTTRNAGKTWVKEERIPNVAIHQIRLRNSDRKLFIYTHGRGIWAADLEFSENFSSVNKLASEKVDLFPNPATSVLNIASDKLAGLEYAIVDLKGTTVKQGVVNGNQIDVTSLKTGNYILKAHSNQVVYTSKFIKQ